MYLDEYLFKSKITHRDFCKCLGITAAHFSHIMTGKVAPSIKIARKVEKETYGYVSWLEFIEGLEGKIEERDRAFKEDLKQRMAKRFESSSESSLQKT